MADKSVIAILHAARARVASGWCQGNAAMRDGTLCMFDDANQWCASGALYAARRATGEREAWHRGAVFLRQAIGSEITRWNDRQGRTQAEVVAAFDRAIALAEQE